MRTATLGWVVLAALGLAGLFAAQPAPTFGCAAIGLKGEPVSIVDEDAIIVWESKKKTQHFIRRANFRTRSANFGFLVPTPSVPKLSEVADGVFNDLSQAILPKVREVSGGIEFMSYFMPSAKSETTAGMMKKSEEKKDAVRVLDKAKVGGFNAVVLEADDPVALEKWLQDNGYPSTPEISGWLGPYLADKWKITAFKIETDAQTGQAVASTQAVKMSFAAERPFFPYREPEAKEPAAKDEGGRRVLRVFFLSDERMAGKLGSLPWHAKTVWADRVDDTLKSELPKSLTIPGEDLPQTLWLTAFEDTASPRPGSAEVFFDGSTDKSVVHPPDILVHRAPMMVPVELVFFAVLLLVLAVLGLRKVLKKA